MAVSSRSRWRDERRWLNRRRTVLATTAAQLYPPEARVSGTSLIAAPGWLPAEPMDLEAVTIELDEHPHPVEVDGTEPVAAAMRHGLPRYTDAMAQLSPPALFEDRPSYRLLDVALDEPTLRFGMGHYFDKLDVSEALGHELAAAMMDGACPTGLPFRNLVGDPFDLRRHATIPAVTTLTIRCPASGPPTFLLHRRDPAKVATAGGTYDVIPAGEFQPSGSAPAHRRNDFDLWRNIVREYAEELLGAPEPDHRRAEPLAYDDWTLYRELGQARRTGRVRALLLGVGLDALTLAATILTTVVIDDDVYEQLFAAARSSNDEGRLLTAADGVPERGLPFTEDSICRLLETEPMVAPGAACLALAWQHRDLVLGRQT